MEIIEQKEVLVEYLHQSDESALTALGSSSCTTCSCCCSAVSSTSAAE